MYKDKKHDYDVVYGVHPLKELLKAKKRTLHALYTTKPEPKGFKIIQGLLTKRTTVHYVNKNTLNTMAGCTDHQGIVGLATPFVYASDICNPKQFKKIVLLDNIQDPRNLGAIIRSAYCSFIDGIMLTTKNTAPLSGAVCKASAGLIEYMPIMKISSAAQAYQILKKNGYHVYLAVLDNGVNATTVEFQEPTCLVIGNEEIGIGKTNDQYGTRITLPQRASDISYNASVAASILFFLLANNKIYIK